jgi:hypothetical protein
MESPRLRDPLNRSTCKIEKTRTDPAESNSEIFLFFRKSDEALVCLNGSYGPDNLNPNPKPHSLNIYKHLQTNS